MDHTTTSTVKTDAAALRWVRWASYASVGVAVVLILAKLTAFLATDSVSVLSTLIDSLLDAFASVIILLAVRTASMPPDAEHRFGHGKAEPLGALAQALFVSGSAVLLFIEAGHRLLTSPQTVTQVPLGIAVMVLSLVLTGCLILFQRFVIRRSGSIAIGADALHYRTDFLVNGAVILALWFGQQHSLAFVDPLIAFGIGSYILYSAWHIGRGALDMLMDREIPDPDKAKIIDLAFSYPEVAALHDLRTRRAGPNAFVQMHIELDGTMPLSEAHRIADGIEKKIRTAFPGIDVLVHQDTLFPLGRSRRVDRINRPETSETSQAVGASHASSW
ncbi:MAG: cation diffusion facilitator family transporter [Alphaproteobacteria bacterium]